MQFKLDRALMQITLLQIIEQFQPLHWGCDFASFFCGVLRDFNPIS